MFYVEHSREHIKEDKGIETNQAYRRKRMGENKNTKCNEEKSVNYCNCDCCKPSLISYFLLSYFSYIFFLVHKERFLIFLVFFLFPFEIVFIFLQYTLSLLRVWVCKMCITKMPRWWIFWIFSSLILCWRLHWNAS